MFINKLPSCLEAICMVVKMIIFPLIRHKSRIIVFIEEAVKLDELQSLWKFSINNVCLLSDSQFLMPGLVDTHIHASQYVYTGTALDLGLLEWLEKYTFPIESTFKDLKFAEHAYTKAVHRVVKSGTTTACYFATIHLQGTIKLCQIISDVGQRALVGKVNMDCNSPDFYQEDSTDSIQDTERFVETLLNQGNANLIPVLTPRFALTCTPKLMSALGEIAASHNLPIQSHLGESKGELDAVRSMHPGYDSYSDVYDKCGLLTSRTIMAHCIYLTEDELNLLKTRGVGVSHCPNSNTSIRSGLMDARDMLDRGIKLGLGTDVSGGYHPSMLDAMRQAIQVSNIVSFEHHEGENYKPLDYREVFRLATLGGSQVLNLEDKIGNFEVGKEFDALLVNFEALDSPFDVFERDTLEDKIQKFIFLGDDRNIEEVYVAGKNITCNNKLHCKLH
ncbi:unnamed protein product [Owenia fusiformis]|uniref:Guanine deaminase n=1 Tax=Owenia fusiformis TaxID=6347 RepID=A0A8S4P7L4_OWEFU|nr:unnamed protein product [Owenia fusiformis]